MCSNICNENIGGRGRRRGGRKRRKKRRRRRRIRIVSYPVSNAFFGIRQRVLGRLFYLKPTTSLGGKCYYKPCFTGTEITL